MTKGRNPNLNDHRAAVLGEVCVNATNTLILLALRSNEPHRQEIILEIEALLRAYLQADIGDEIIGNANNLDKLTQLHKLNSRQKLILSYAVEHQKTTIENCQNMLPHVSRRTLQRDIKSLCDRNLLLAQGNTDLRIYRPNSEILCL